MTPTTVMGLVGTDQVGEIAPSIIKGFERSPERTTNLVVRFAEEHTDLRGAFYMGLGAIARMDKIEQGEPGRNNIDRLSVAIAEVAQRGIESKEITEDDIWVGLMGKFSVSTVITIETAFEQRDLVSEDIKKELGIDSVPDVIPVSWFNELKSPEADSEHGNGTTVEDQAEKTTDLLEPLEFFVENGFTELTDKISQLRKTARSADYAELVPELRSAFDRHPSSEDDYVVEKFNTFIRDEMQRKSKIIKLLDLASIMALYDARIEPDHEDDYFAGEEILAEIGEIRDEYFINTMTVEVSSIENPLYQESLIRWDLVASEDPSDERQVRRSEALDVLRKRYLKP